MNEQRQKAVLARLAAIEARLAAIEGDDDWCCEPQSPEEKSARYRSVPVGAVTRQAISADLFICAQLHEIPTLRDRGVDHSLVTSWIENKEGKRIGRVTCSCSSGNCNISKTCDKGDPECDCVNCTLTCS